MRSIKRHFPSYVDNLQKAYSNGNRYGQPIWKLLPQNTMLAGHQICKKVGIPDRSIRHTIPSGHEGNYRVLGVLLDIEFYQNYILGVGWNSRKTFHELSAKLERGVEDLEVLRNEGRLKETLLITDDMVQIVEQILDTGSCDYLNNLLDRITEQDDRE